MPSSEETKGFEVWFWTKEDERAFVERRKKGIWSTEDDEVCMCTKVTCLKADEASPSSLIDTALDQLSITVYRRSSV
ncbi:hypothetical protein L596_016349 [Steinernema carpocapsae]|uniref:Uncharacterized protein n=1 Tax=Steinernema carpocapsae TaxID=34508 RepID=A0A4U5NHQ8_STECR|nr:hypothetical protein L596_016349 [Steinernema carpocapsae]